MERRVPEKLGIVTVQSYSTTGLSQHITEELIKDVLRQIIFLTAKKTL